MLEEGTKSVSVGAGALELVGAGTDDKERNRRLATAVNYFMAERDRSRPGWAYPDFRRDGRDGDRAKVSCELEIDSGLWNRFLVEARRQGVTADQLLEHALLYLAAHHDSGALAERLGRDLSS